MPPKVNSMDAGRGNDKLENIYPTFDDSRRQRYQGSMIIATCYSDMEFLFRQQNLEYSFLLSSAILPYRYIQKIPTG